MSETNYDDAYDYGQTRKRQRQPTSTEQELSARQEEEKQYVVSRRLQALKEVQRSRARPVETRVREIGNRGFYEAKRSYGKTATKGVSKLRQIASGFNSVRGSVQGSERSGLSTVVDEFSEKFIPQFERQYFNGSNPCDRQFFSVENQPKERDFFGHGSGSNIDMTCLTNIENKKKEVLV